MTQDVHQQAREWIAVREELSDERHRWLRQHLAECAECRNYADAADRMIAALRSVSVAADARLVRATQMRVRFHADRLRQTRERMWLVGMACLAVGLSATLTVPLLWGLFAWMGARAGVSNTVWQAGFACFWIVPALVVSLLLLARGTHVRSHEERSQQWR